MLKITYLPASKLVPFAKNSRTHSSAQVAQIVESIKAYGWTNPILIDENNEIIAGHGRLLAAEVLALDKVACIRLEGLSEEKRRALRLADNKIAMNSGWDNTLLAEELGFLEEAEFDLSLTGFGIDELTRLLNTEPDPGLTDPDAIPETQELVISKPGDIWILGDHRLACEDSTMIDAVDRLMNGGLADLVFTDPPYGVDYEGGTKKRTKLANDETSTNIYARVLPVAFVASKPSAALYLWFSDSKSAATTVSVLSAIMGAGYEVRNTIIWNKNMAQFGSLGAQYKSKHEPCLYAHKKGCSPFWAGPTNEVGVWDVSRAARNDLHPTQKPVELAERAIANSCPRKGVVLDLFGGSGSTLIACDKMGRKARLVEISPQYCDVIVRRWEAFNGGAATHEGSGKTFAQIEKAAKKVKA